MKVSILLAVGLIVASSVSHAREVSVDWDWQLSASDSKASKSHFFPNSEPSSVKGIDGLLSLESRINDVAEGNILGLFSAKANNIYSDSAENDFESELIVQELLWQGDIELFDTYLELAFGKSRVDWGVGYGYRPLDVFKPYRRNPVGIQVEEGAGVLSASHYDMTGEWTLIATDSSWSSQQSTELEEEAEQKGVGIRRYILDGDNEWQWMAYYDDVRQGLIGGSFVTVLTPAIAVHTSALYQRDYVSYKANSDPQQIRLATSSNGFQMLAGINWANEVGNNVIVEYWFDNRAWSKNDWKLATSTSKQQPNNPWIAMYGNGLSLANLVQHNLMLHWNLDAFAWSQWQWTSTYSWLENVTPTFDVLYSPQDNGYIATQWLDYAAYDSGSSAVNIELAARFFGGSDDAVYANIGDKRMIFINLKGRF